VSIVVRKRTQSGVRQMTLQSVVSLTVIGLVVARAVNAFT